MCIRDRSSDNDMISNPNICNTSPNPPPCLETKPHQLERCRNRGLREGPTLWETPWFVRDCRKNWSAQKVWCRLLVLPNLNQKFMNKRQRNYYNDTWELQGTSSTGREWTIVKYGFLSCSQRENKLWWQIVKSFSVCNIMSGSPRR